MSHSWHRLDGGWEWYAAKDINGHYGRAMNLLDRMLAVLREMDEALVKTADLQNEWWHGAFHPMWVVGEEATHGQ